MGKSLTSLDVSGIYTCSCGNLETHIQSKSKAPCSSCSKNSSWNLLIETEELEKLLKNPYFNQNEIGRLIVQRFVNRSY